MGADSDLHARLAGGDVTALADAYDLHAPYVYGLAMKITGSTAQAEDITQDLFVALWERPLAFDPACGSLREWLLIRAMHQATMMVRQPPG